MAMEIHENLKNYIKYMITKPNEFQLVKYNGELIKLTKSYTASNLFDQFAKIIGSYNVNADYMEIKVGSGQRTADADYRLGNIITTVSGYYQKRITNGNTSIYTASATNTGTEDITITEIGLFFNPSSNYSSGFMAAYEHLDSPITVKAGETFTINASLTYDLFS